MGPLIALIIGICMVLLFSSAALHKLRAAAVFKATVDEYQLIPRQLSRPVSELIMAAEVLSVVLVLIAPVRIAGFSLMAALLLIYTAGIGINLARGRRDIDCGCSGPASRHELSGWLVLRNLVLLTLVLFCLAQASFGGSVPGFMTWLDGLVTLFAVTGACILYMSLNQLLSQAPRLAALRAGT